MESNDRYGIAHAMHRKLGYVTVTTWLCNSDNGIDQLVTLCDICSTGQKGVLGYVESHVFYSVFL